MSRIVLLPGPALGHVGRLLVLAGALREAGHAAHFVMAGGRQGRFVHIVREAGFPVDLIELAGAKTGAPPFFDQYADALPELLDAAVADAVVYDMNIVRWLATASLGARPGFFVTNVYNTGLSDMPTSVDVNFAEEQDIINTAREARGLAPLASAFDLIAGHRVLLADWGAVADLYRRPAHFSVCGPMSWTLPAPMPAELGSQGDLLLIAMGSTGRALPDAATVAELKQRFGCRAVAYLGGDHDSEPVRAIADYRLASAPMDALLARTRLAITQGGAGSTYLALQARVPVAVVPTHPTQGLLGRCLERLGVGLYGESGNALRAAAEQTDPAAMQERLDSLYDAEPYRDGARRAAELVARAGEETHV